MYRLKETEGARRPPRARQRHRTTGPHAIHQRAFQKGPQETDSQCTTKPSPYRKDTPGEPKVRFVLVNVLVLLVVSIINP